MALRYQTGTATLIQLAVMVILNFANGIVSIGTQCVQHDDCVSNTIVTLLYIIVLAAWLAFVAAVGFAAQDRRSRRMAQLLIVAEAMIALVALFDLRHYPNVLGLITSLVDFCLAVWVIVLAWRLTRAKGGRITTNQARARRRPSPRS